jgi:hypothetical protein
MAVNARPGVMWAAGDIMADTRTIEVTGKWY